LQKTWEKVDNKNENKVLVKLIIAIANQKERNANVRDLNFE